MRNVALVLGTYNGAAYLWDQWRSLAAQGFTDWRMFVRDDGSQDETSAVLARMAEDPRVEIVSDNLGRLGPVQNYSLLLTEALHRNADAVFLVDQDDVWLPEKMSKQLEVLDRVERKSPELAVAVHSDLAVVGPDLRLRHSSYMKSESLHHESNDPVGTLAVQNFVTGCTMLINRPALEAALPIPKAAIMHDWWIALCTAAIGELKFVPMATVLYRQHSGNVLGAKGYWKNVRAALARSVNWRRKLPEHLRDVLTQAWWAGAWVKPLAPRSADRLLAFGEILGEPALPTQRLSKLRRVNVRRQDALRHFVLQTRIAMASELLDVSSESEYQSTFGAMETRQKSARSSMVRAGDSSMVTPVR